jgi:polysaccharide chain length determinant protein (PEP-CTERM system associated)
MIPWAIISVGTVLYSRTLPDRYRSDSVIQVVPPRVPENLVRSTITSKIDERLPAISQQILSRTRLERVIQDFGLYAQERKTTLMEDIVKAMRDDINGPTIVKGDAFRISYVSNDPKMAMKVTERLASLFVEENLRDREVLAEGANQFLDSQLDDARRRLLEHEKKLEEFRRQYNGELPNQLGANVQAIQNTQNQIQALSESINRDRDRKILLERTLADANVEAVISTGSAGIVAPARGSAEAEGAPLPAAAQLAAARRVLETMKLRYKDTHPDVMGVKRVIRDLEKQAEAEALQTPVSQATEASRTSPAERLRQNRIRDINAEMAFLDKEIVRKQELQKKLQGTAGDLDRRVEATPTRESEMTALTRDYDTLQRLYTTLLSKSEDAKVAANLERRQIGEQFKVIDAARLPGQPFSPNRVQINSIGVGVGLLIGLALIGFIEYSSNSFRTDEEVLSVLALPVLATVPAIITTREKQVARRMRFIATGVGAVGALFVAAVLTAWKVGFLDRWL